MIVVAMPVGGAAEVPVGAPDTCARLDSPGVLRAHTRRPLRR